MEGAVLALNRHGLRLVLVVGVAATLGACASKSGREHVGFTGGGDCLSVRSELKKLDAQGTPGQIQAKAAGQKLSAEAAGRVDRYNKLLEEYLGNECQLPPS